VLADAHSKIRSSHRRASNRRKRGEFTTKLAIAVKKSGRIRFNERGGTAKGSQKKEEAGSPSEKNGSPLPPGENESLRRSKKKKKSTQGDK